VIDPPMPRSDHARMPTFLRCLLILLLALAGPLAFAQDAPNAGAVAALTPAQTLTQLRSQLDDIKAVVDSKKADVPLNELRDRAQAVQQQAVQVVSTLSPQSASLQARMEVLGPAPVKGVPAESPQLSAQRRQLGKEKGELDGQIKQANSLATEAGQLATHVAELRRDKFQTQLASRTATPFSRAFWTDPAMAFSDDMARVRELGSDVGTSMRQAWEAPNRLPFVLCLIIAIILITVGRWLIERTLVRITTDRMPAGKLRRSALAVAITLAYTLAVGLAAQFVYLALNWNDLLADDLDDLAHRLVRLVAFAAFVTGLGRAMLSSNRPSWRLPALSDDAAQRLRAFPWLMGVGALAIRAVEDINSAIGVSLATTVTTRAFLALMIGLLVGYVLLRLGQSRRATLAAGETPAQRPLWIGLVIAAAFIGVGMVLLGVASGYIAFAFFIARQMLWFAVVLTALYLMLHLVDDIFDTLFAPKSSTGVRMQSSFGIGSGALEQTGTVLSGVVRATLVILAVAFVLAPFGAGPQELVGRVVGLFSGASTLGNLPIVPGLIFEAALVFALGLIIVRVIKKWLSEQLLPKTALDPGMQNSMVTLLGYVGGVLVFVAALATLKVDLQSIAWMASALSVGIGFGLQAIVQNFISGLILLAERPVKVGDWVSIGGVEGDIRRINVRATEIQMSDRSTTIVPNSQFITSNVRNVTLANAQGRVSIKLSMPLDTDASKARALLLDVLRGHPGTLSTPAPAVTLENLDAGAMTFACIAYVNSPRDVGNVKSDVLFEMLERLRAARLPLTSPQSMVVRTLPAVADGNDDRD
jgi:potassium efflux system protein